MAEVATSATSEQLLVVIDPAARQTDGESVRIAKDVLSAGAATKVCLPDGPEEFARALARRGSRRPVVIGDDRALLRAVALLHRRRELTDCVLSVVPVGSALTLASALGVPTTAVTAARAVLLGAPRRVDLLVDDSDGVVLGALTIPPLSGAAVLSGTAVPPGAGRPGTPGTGAGTTGAGTGTGTTGTGTDRGMPGKGGTGAGAGDCAPAPARALWLRSCRSLVRTLVPARPARLMGTGATAPTRLRVEADGTTLIDLDQPVSEVSITPDGTGAARIVIRPVSVGAEASPLRAVARRVTVTGADFHYGADAETSGPVRRRTWTVRGGALGLTLPG
ncbi:diacylglycerol kinase family protein [Streptomyces sp. NPDC088789]|uniref:diacylglycerol kinase family protein n=1 Tax=Streptomyces sp. NPDC088789 TaxID=3365899 RepID=UPI00381F243B